MFFQRYVEHLPAAGEVVIFDRCWYNRAGIERVMGFCTRGEVAAVPGPRPFVEQTMVESGIQLIKYWLEVNQAEQTRRLQSRIDDPRKIWKLSRHGPQVLLEVVGLRTSPRRHVPRQRHVLGAVVRGPYQRQTDGDG